MTLILHAERQYVHKRDALEVRLPLQIGYTEVGLLIYMEWKIITYRFDQ